MTASEQIFTLLSPLVGGKCYPLIVPETQANNPPYIVYQLVSTTPTTTIDGITGHEWATVQVDVYSADYDDLLDLSAGVIDRINTIKPSEYGGSQYTKDGELFRCSLDFGLWQTHPFTYQPNQDG